MKTSSLTQSDYWLLETAVEFSIPICFVHGKDVEVRFNKSGHKLDRDGIIKALERLYSRGLIEAYWDNDEETPVKLSYNVINVALNELVHTQYGSWSCLRYQLTAKGGASWEQFACPDWNKFIYFDGLLFDGLSGGFDCQTTFSVCADKLRLQQYLDGLHYVDITLYPESIEWTVEQPWQATYWKLLPLGYRATHRCKDNENQTTTFDHVPKAYMDIYAPKWYKRAI